MASGSTNPQEQTAGQSTVAAGEVKHPRTGLRFARRFTQPGVDPYDEIEWELRDAVITNETARRSSSRSVEVPRFWSPDWPPTSWAEVLPRPTGHAGARDQRAPADRPRGRHDPRLGREGRYFATEEDAATFQAELTYLLVHQMVSFNSPVWFNVGVEEHPQFSACFINSVDDTMESILDLAKTEGMLFKFGSGTGSNLSTLRSRGARSPAAAPPPGRSRS